MLLASAIPMASIIKAKDHLLYVNDPLFIVIRESVMLFKVIIGIWLHPLA